MPYTTPKTWASGDVLTAADLNTYVRDNVAFSANPPKVRVFMSAAVNVATSTASAPTFDSERFDTDTMHSTTVNTDRITFTTAGTYLIGANLDWAANGTGSRSADFLLNGVTVIPGQTYPANTEAGFSTLQSPSTLYAFTAGQYATLRVRQNSGGAINLNTCEFYAVWVSL